MAFLYYYIWDEHILGNELQCILDRTRVHCIRNRVAAFSETIVSSPRYPYAFLLHFSPHNPSGKGVSALAPGSASSSCTHSCFALASRLFLSGPACHRTSHVAFAFFPAFLAFKKLWHPEGRFLFKIFKNKWHPEGRFLFKIFKNKWHPEGRFFLFKLFILKKFRPPGRQQHGDSKQWLHNRNA